DVGACRSETVYGVTRTREREDGPVNHTGVKDRVLRQHCHRIELGSEPIEEDGELEHAEDADPGDTERDAADPGVPYARGQVRTPERRDQAAEEQELTQAGGEREELPHLRHREDDDLSDPRRIEAEQLRCEVEPHSEEGEEQPTARGLQAR